MDAPVSLGGAYAPLRFGSSIAPLAAMARDYRAATLSSVVLLTLAAMLGGISLAALLPLMSGLIDATGAGFAAGDHWLVAAMAALGLPLTVPGLLLAIVAIFVLKGMVRGSAEALVGLASSRLITDHRERLIRAMVRASWDFHVHEPAGAVAHALGVETRRLGKGLVAACSVYASIVQALVYLGVALLISWQLGLAVVVVGGVVLVSLAWLLRASRLETEKKTQFQRALLVRIADGLQSIKSVKAMHRIEPFQQLLVREATGINRHNRRAGVLQAALEALQEPIVVVTVAGIGYLALFVAGTSAAALITMAIAFQRGMHYVLLAQRELRATMVANTSYWVLVDVIERAEQAAERWQGAAAPTLDSGVSLRDVVVYRGDEPVLRAGTFDIPAGAVTLLEGPSGSGKTTLADIICGLLEPDAGNVSVDGVPLAELDITQWRKKIGYVPQDLRLSRETIRFNVALGATDADDDAVRRALEEAGAWEFVARLPAGLDASVGVDGQELSGGQRQRVLLARALLNRPDLLVFDEPTTALDAKMTADFCAMLRTLVPRHTVLVISHQSALRAAADSVIEVSGGDARRVA